MGRAELTEEGLERLNSPASICLVTVMKSGTHWARYLLANYLKIMVRGPDCSRATYEELQSVFSPNDRRLCLRTKTEPVRSPLYPVFGYQDVMWQHVSEDLSEYRGRIVFLFRNPLDYLISRYHYDKALWQSEGRDVSSPAATMEWSLRWYAESLTFMLKLIRQKRDAVVLTYENLKQAPEVSLEILLRSLGIPVRRDALQLAVERSDAKKVAAEEVERGRAIVGPTTSGYFVRDSGVGQWRNHLTEDDLSRAEKILGGYGLRLAQFQIQ
jgi:hypothetical protein